MTRTTRKAPPPDQRPTGRPFAVPGPPRDRAVRELATNLFRDALDRRDSRLSENLNSRATVTRVKAEHELQGLARAAVFAAKALDEALEGKS